MLPVVVLVALVSVRQARVDRDDCVRLEDHFVAVGDVSLQDSDQILLPSRVVESFSLARQRHLYTHTQRRPHNTEMQCLNECETGASVSHRTFVDIHTLTWKTNTI